MNPALEWVRAFAFTLVLEEAVVLAMSRDDALSRARRAALIFFANLATHPSVWFTFPLVFSGDASRILASEAWAIGLEAIFYALTMKMTPARAFGVSAIANGVSFGIGIAVRATLGWV